MDYIITHYPDKKRFETQVDGVTAFVQYRLSGDKLDIIHTIVPPAIGGRGIAAALVKYAYDYAVENGMKPSATCSYAVTWLHRHPDYAGCQIFQSSTDRYLSGMCGKTLLPSGCRRRMRHSSVGNLLFRLLVGWTG